MCHKGGGATPNNNRCHNFSILEGHFPLYKTVAKSIFTIKHHSSNLVEGLLGPVLGGARLAGFLDAQVLRRIKVPEQLVLHSIVEKEGEELLK